MTIFSFDATKTENTALRVGIVCSRFNEFIVQALLDGAHRGLSKCGVDANNVDVAWVPGAYEIPVAARAMALSGRYELLIALGAVIRGDTTKAKRPRLAPSKLGMYCRQSARQNKSQRTHLRSTRSSSHNEHRETETSWALPTFLSLQSRVF